MTRTSFIQSILVKLPCLENCDSIQLVHSLVKFKADIAIRRSGPELSDKYRPQ